MMVTQEGTRHLIQDEELEPRVFPEQQGRDGENLIDDTIIKETTPVSAVDVCWERVEHNFRQPAHHPNPWSGSHLFSFFFLR